MEWIIVRTTENRALAVRNRTPCPMSDPASRIPCVARPLFTSPCTCFCTCTSSYRVSPDEFLTHPSLSLFPSTWCRTRGSIYARAVLEQRVHLASPSSYHRGEALAVATQHTASTPGLKAGPERTGGPARAAAGAGTRIEREPRDVFSLSAFFRRVSWQPALLALAPPLPPETAVRCLMQNIVDSLDGPII